MERCMNCMKEYETEEGKCPYCGFREGTPAKEGFHMNPGVVLKNRYEVGTVTSYGGFGVVYVGWDTTLDCKVAIKEYFPSGLITREPGTIEVRPVKNSRAEREFHAGKERFLKEAQIMSKYDGHPSIVSIMDYFEANNTAYIIMEFLEGITLKQYIKNVESLGERVDIETAVEITKSICDILAELHKGSILHRDIAPDNIFICMGGTVKLIDFGAARLAEKDKQLTKVLKMGFAPPEQYSTDKEQGTYTDVYALGATLYRTITGEMPDEASNRASLKEGAIAKNDTLIAPKEINSDISEQLSNTILRAMAITPGMRFQTMEEFKEALEGKTKALDPRKELQRRKKRRILGVLIAVFVIGTGMLVGMNLYNSKKIQAELPTGVITVWVPSEEEGICSDLELTKNMKIMISEFSQNYPHVKVEVETVKTTEYESKLITAKRIGNAPTLFLQRELQENYSSDDLAEVTGVNSYLKPKDYYMSDEMQKLMKEKRQLPTGYVETVLYQKKEAPDLDEAGKLALLEKQVEKGFSAALQEFETGTSQYLIAGTDYYYEFFQNREDTQILVNHVVNAGNVKVQPFDSEKVYGYLSDYWCINVTATEKQKQCANVLLAYFLAGNCQRSFFTVEGEKQSCSAPLYKEVYDTNYFENLTEHKIPFLQDDIDKLVLINEYNGLDDYYRLLLKKVKNA